MNNISIKIQKNTITKYRNNVISIDDYVEKMAHYFENVNKKNKIIII